MAASSEPVAPAQRLELELPPSCLEFCPAYPSHFLVGTYNLVKEEEDDEEEGEAGRDGGASAAGGRDEADGSGDAGERPVSGRPQNRNGSILVFGVSEGTATLVQAVSRPSAILDLHFQPARGGGDVCGVVSSTGTISLFRLTPSDGAGRGEAADAAPLAELATVRLPGIGEDVLFTAMAWHPTAAGVLAVTASTGHVYVAKLTASNSSGKLGAVPAARAPILHTLEAWCLAFSADAAPREGRPYSTLYSGGDDSALRYVSCAVGDGPEDGGEDCLPLELPYAAVTVKGHGAGVTAILPLSAVTSAGARLVVTGSYDDVMRVYAVQPLHESRGLRNAQLLAELDLGGGVWRLRLIEELGSDPDSRGRRGVRATVLASCMHAGARVVEVAAGLGEGAECRIRVLARFEEHKSMNYGSDFQPGGGGQTLLCASTSFYDKLLCLWSFTRRDG